MSDNFDRKVCYEFGWIAYLRTQLAPITKQCLIMFRLCCKKLVLTIKENTKAKHAQL